MHKNLTLPCRLSRECRPHPNSTTSTTLTTPQRAETDFFSGPPLEALTTLVYSDNVDLQRSASLTFAEITERGEHNREPDGSRPNLQPSDVREVGRDTLDPILFLLQNNDTEVQRAASAALGNLAVNSMSKYPTTSIAFH